MASEHKANRRKSFVIMSSLSVVVFLSLMFTIMPLNIALAETSPQWHNTDWQLRNQITIDSADIDSDLTDYPLYVNVTQIDIGIDTQADCDDILFTAADGTTKLSHEIENCDTDDILEAWVKIPTVSSLSDTTIFMYYNNPNAADQQDAQNVWRSEYRLVWHLHDDFNDSSTQNNHGINSGSTDIDTHLGDGQEFDGTDDHIDRGSDSATGIDVNQKSMSVWVKTSTSTTSSPMLMTANTVSSGGFTASLETGEDTTGVLRFAHKQTPSGVIAWETSDTFNDDNWHHLLITHDRSSVTNDPLMYIDGVNRTVTQVSGTEINNFSTGDDNIRSGENVGGNADFTGTLDELRIYSGTLSSAWIKADWECQRFDDSCIMIGQEESFGANLLFNQDPHVLEHSGYVIYKNSTLADNQETDSIIATIKSKSDATGFTITLTEDEDDGYLQSNYIKFSESPSAGELEVAEDDWVYASYDTLSSNSTVTSGNGTQLHSTTRFDNSPADCSNYGGNDDADAICDNWEIQNSTQSGLNINHPSGNGTYQYECDPSCPDPDYEDIYIEIDYMIGHKPNEKAVQHLIDAFLDSPVTNPNGTDGINVHIQLDDSDAGKIFHHKEEPVTSFHADCTKYPGLDFNENSKGFNQIKAQYFGTEDERENHPDWDNTGWKQKKQVFHYVLFVHQRCGSGTSGTAEVFGNDVMMSLGPFSGQMGSTDEQEGTLLHELGHNLNLHHGGSNSINCKPNHISVMNYAFQFSDLVSDRELDFSRKAIGTMVNGSTSIVENNLNENDGLGSYSPDPERRTVYGPIVPLNLPFTNSSIDWNQDGDSTDTGLTVNINKLESIGCTSSSSTETLAGHDDWENIDLDFKGSGNWVDGRSNNGTVADQEITIEQVRKMRELRIDSLMRAVQDLPDEVFTDRNRADLIKNQQIIKINEIKDLISQDKIISVLGKLEQFRLGFDESQKIPDIITDNKQKKNILEGLDEIIKSLHKATR